MRFGVIGCGRIAQIMHLPYLAELPGVELHALADPAANLRGAMGERYGISNRYADAAALVDDAGGELDAVVVCTPPHAHLEAVTATLGAGIDTLVEKPLALAPGDADRLVEVEAESDAVAMVAYNKRYDPAYERAREHVDSLDGIDLITAYDTDPDHDRIVGEVYDLVPAELEASFLEESAAERSEQCKRAIGTDDDGLAAAYSFQVEHVCHDVNLLRGLFGAVESIEHVDVFADGRYATANLVYEGGLPCVLETGIARRKWFEEWVRVDGPDGMVRLEFANPFIKNAPTELRVKRGIEELTEEVISPSVEESFKRELSAFVGCARGEREVRTTFEEARADVELIADLFRFYRGEPVRGEA